MKYVLTTLILFLSTPLLAANFTINPTTSFSSGAVSNPSSTLTLPATTTAYAVGNLIANSATAGSVVVPFFNIVNGGGGGALIPRVRLYTNDTTSTSWGAVSLQVDLWSSPPTWTNGDRGAFSPATGTSSHIGSFSCVMSSVYGDGAYAECAPNVGTVAMPNLPGTSATIYWSLQAVTASGVTGANKTFTLVPEILN